MQIRRDAGEIWRLYLKYRGKPGKSVRGILPAWAADEYMLGRGDIVDRALEEASRRGYLGCASAYACFGEPRDAAGYIRALKGLLHKTGYIRG